MNNVLKGKLLKFESARSAGIEQYQRAVLEFAGLRQRVVNAIIDALAVHGVMSKQALGSSKVQAGLKHILLGPAQLYEALRARGEGRP